MLEAQAAARQADEAAALAEQVEAIQAAAALEADKLGQALLAKYREETEALAEAVRATAQSRFQEAVDDAGRVVSAEFDAVMGAMETRRALNAERARVLQEQLAVVDAQLAAMRRLLLQHKIGRAHV